MEDIDCQDLVEIVTDYLEGKLPEIEAARLEAHIKECDGCDAYLSQIYHVRRILGSTDVREFDPSVRDRFIDAFHTWNDDQAS